MELPNPPSERDWTIEEQEEFFASQDAVTGMFNGTPINNTPYHPSPMETEPITLSSLLKMKEDFDKQFPEPIKYKDGADMSPETWQAMVRLGNPNFTYDGETEGFASTPFISIAIHIVPGMPFGAVEECRCKERYKLKFQALNPTPPQDLPSMVEFTQEMPLEEAKKRWPNTPVPGEEKK